MQKFMWILICLFTAVTANYAVANDSGIVYADTPYKEAAGFLTGLGIMEPDADVELLLVP